MDNRRQSGLWSQNPDTGYFQQQSTPSSQKPYTYYQPPARSGSNRQSGTFAERMSGFDDGYTSTKQNGVSGGIPGLGSVHQKLFQSVHTFSGDTNATDFANVGHINSTSMPGSSVQPKIRSADPNAVPENVRAEPWRDSVTGAKQDNSPARRKSIPDRSPLQRLEAGSTKEEKRARMESAEHRSRQRSLGTTAVPVAGDMQRQGALRSEKGRVVSDGSRRPSESNSDKYYTAGQRDSTRNTQNGIGRSVSTNDTNGSERFHRASHALRQETTSAATRNSRSYDRAPEVPLSMYSGRSRGVGQPAIAQNPRPYHHAPEVPRSMDSTRTGGSGLASNGIANSSRGINGAQPSRYSNPEPQRASSDEQRTPSGNYQHRLRDAGYVGAAAAAAGATGIGAYEGTKAYENRNAADRGKAAYERSRGQSTTSEPVGPELPQQDLSRGGSVTRTRSKRLQKKSGPPAGYGNIVNTEKSRGSMEQPRKSSDQSRDINTNGVIAGRQQLQTDRIGGNVGSKKDVEAEERYNDPDDPTRDQVASKDKGVPYTVPPQTAAGRAARDQVGFNPQHQDESQSRGGFFHRHHNGASPRGFEPQSKPLEEWRDAEVVKLSVADLDFDKDSKGQARDNTWWENNSNRRSSSSRQGQPPVSAAQNDGPYEEEAKAFQPPMFLKCGPLLRYTGMRHEGEDREIWRGSVMIVTEDSQSDYSSAPVLRIFAQPMALAEPPPRELLESGQGIPPEFEDPVAGQVKVSRTGRPLYVRPVHEIEHGLDLSREENNQGLYAATRTAVLGPQFSASSEGRQSPHVAFQDKSRVKGRDGEKAGRYREVRAVRLHAERGVTFWRWSIEIELGSTQHRVVYRINKGPALGFWVPGRGTTMNSMFHSCNGFSLSVDSDDFSGPDPLWRDVLNKHQMRPFHVMIGGGDQIYNDAAMRDTTLFREWLQEKNPEHKHGTGFSLEMQDELESFYLNRYSMWFSQGLFAMAGSQIPMVNIWDDHDIIDGYGSYPHHFMSTRVFTGLGAIAFKYYMLFQHQSVAAETTKEEPSWVLGASPGPYINERSRSLFMSLGKHVKLLGVDCRTERMRDEVLSQESYDILFDRCRAEIVSGETRHLVVLLGVPIAYPRLNFLENILTSKVMDPIKALGRTGALGGFVNKFDGGVEILDDLDDHWTAKHHKAERNWFIQELQELAAEKSVRVTILGGDVHLGAVGQFYTPKKFGISKDRDHRYMPNVISSAIVNTPPPTMMADVLNKRNKVHHLDSETDEDLIPMFEVDVDGSKRNNKCLLPRRNYCTIREFAPGTTPPSTPPPERNEYLENDNGKMQQYPPGSMSRTRSLTRGPGSLLRRLSGSRQRNPPSSLGQQGGTTRPGMGRSASLNSARSNYETESRRPSFHRRPTNVSVKEVRRAAARGGAPDEEGNHDNGREAGEINLEGGLDISLNMEVDQHDPSGSTQRYRLLVPALWYSGASDVNSARFKSKGAGFISRFTSRKSAVHQRDGHDDDHDDQYFDDEDGRMRTSTPPPANGERPMNSTGGDWSEARNSSAIAAPTTNGAYTNAAPTANRNLYAPPPGKPTANDPYPSSNYRNTITSGNDERSSQPVQRGSAYMEGSEGSLTPSEAYYSDDDQRDPEPQPPQRRYSKAERFFGLGGAAGSGGGTRGSGGRGSGGRSSGGWGRRQTEPVTPGEERNFDGSYGFDEGEGTGYEDREEEGRRKKRWQVWK